MTRAQQTEGASIATPARLSNLSRQRVSVIRREEELNPSVRGLATFTSRWRSTIFVVFGSRPAVDDRVRVGDAFLEQVVAVHRLRLSTARSRELSQETRESARITGGSGRPSPLPPRLTAPRHKTRGSGREWPNDRGRTQAWTLGSEDGRDSRERPWEDAQSPVLLLPRRVHGCSGCNAWVNKRRK